jgi:hypothetical protein
MKNILDIQNDLKNTSDEHLVNLMQMPEPNFPQYLVLSEMDRRKEMRESYEAQQNVAQQQPTVAQELTMDTAQSGMQQGLGGLPIGSLRGAELQSRATDMPVIYGNQPVQSMAGSVGMANGGRTGYQNAGQVDPSMVESHENRNPEQENVWIGEDGILFDTSNPVDYALAATMAIPIVGWGLGLGAKLSMLGGRLVSKGLPSLGKFAHKRGFVPDYGGKGSIPIEQMGKQYLQQGKPYLPFGSEAFPGKFTSRTAPALAGTAFALSRFAGGEDEATTPPPPPPPPPPSLNGDADNILPPLEVGEVVTEDTGRKEDINTALVSLARIASAKPNELGNILASAGKDVATARRERKRDKLAEELTGAQAEYYKARVKGLEPDAYNKAWMAGISAGAKFDSLDAQEKQKWGVIRQGSVDADTARAREKYIQFVLAPQNLYELWQEFKSIGGGGGGADIIQGGDYATTPVK